MPLTKEHWISALSSHFKPEIHLNSEIWGLLFRKLVENNVFKNDGGKFNLIGTLEERDVLEAYEELKESWAAKPFAEWVKVVRF
jgi:hypothetical protein